MFHFGPELVESFDGSQEFEDLEVADLLEALELLVIRRPTTCGCLLVIHLLTPHSSDIQSELDLSLSESP